MMQCGWLNKVPPEDCKGKVVLLINMLQCYSLIEHPLTRHGQQFDICFPSYYQVPTAGWAGAM